MATSLVLAAPTALAAGDGGFGVGWIIAIGLVAGIGIGFLLSGRNKK